MGGGVDDEGERKRWTLFAQAQLETLLLLRQAHSRLLTEYDEAKAEAAGLRSAAALQARLVADVCTQTAEEADELPRALAAAAGWRDAFYSLQQRYEELLAAGAPQADEGRGPRG
jgi:alkylhydroperoxidase family enzyme